MRELQFMGWDECKNKFIRQVERDNEKISSILSIANQRLKFIQAIKVNKENVSFVVENYYEIVKELLVALFLKNGFKSSNHQCLISYFYRQYPQYECEAHLMLQMSYLRNRLDYYGEQIDIEFYQKNKDDFTAIIALLRKEIEDEADKHTEANNRKSAS